MTLNPTRSNVPHTCVTGIHRVPNFTPFCSMTVVFEMQAILRQLHRMTLKWPWTYKVKSCIPYVLPVSSSIKFQSFNLRPAIFESQAIWDKCTEWPHNDLEHHKVEGTPHMFQHHTRAPNFRLFCSTTSSFQDIAHFLILHWLLR